MKKNLIILLACLFIPLSVEASEKREDKVWLILHSSLIYKARAVGFALEKIEMHDMDHCEEQGAVWQSSDRVSEAGFTTYECLTGK